MSDFNGFVCDSCGEVWTLDKRTRVTMRFENNSYCSLGSYWKDLCPKCIVPPEGMFPVQRGKKTPQPKSVPSVLS